MAEDESGGSDVESQRKAEGFEPRSATGAGGGGRASPKARRDRVAAGIQRTEGTGAHSLWRLGAQRHCQRFLIDGANRIFGRACGARPVFRFAPSPNGYLHLGHAYSALLNQKLAQAHGGRLLLRIEDIDPGRSRPHFETALLEDLNWLGFRLGRAAAPPIGASGRLRAPPSTVLSQRGLAYPCFCSRSDIAARLRGEVGLAARSRRFAALSRNLPDFAAAAATGAHGRGGAIFAASRHGEGAGAKSRRL